MNSTIQLSTTNDDKKESIWSIYNNTLIIHSDISVIRNVRPWCTSKMQTLISESKDNAKIQRNHDAQKTLVDILIVYTDGSMIEGK